MTANPSGRPQADKDSPFAQFSLLGGPFHDFATKAATRVTGGDSLVFFTGLSVFVWLVLALLATVEGHADKFFSLGTTAVHGRFLVAIPLIFWCEKLLAQATRDACAGLVSTGVVTGEAKAALDSDATRLERISDSWWLQFGLLFAVVIFSFSAASEYLPGESAAKSNMTSVSLAGKWYWLVCLPLFRFVMARMFWLLGIWVYLIWRLSRQPLALTASHPDRAGGLGLLEVAQAQLVVFVLGIAALDAAALAETFQHVAPNEAQIYVHVFLVALVGVLVVCGPLLLLVSPLFRCRRRGMIDFSALANAYSVKFQQRWIGPAKPDLSELLGTGDIQSLADLATGYENVRTMRVLPVTNTLLFLILCAAAVPHAPLLLMKYPMTDLISGLVQNIIGI
ncbi:hypothetical protein SAMN04488103_101179 [Gemmobacter aquatilis]|uniref:Uncharacterized protein n=1 Tax=Gemmobacter aquatilis TaxID=933059 RepID=A0A1H7YFD9_9RHOB|nr:hypothetical protein [Gemmobacter aquatilis]SEM44663.1 hypothetical protein SAMN04488103_101179 [Gemmobacter aquatilis]